VVEQGGRQSVDAGVLSGGGGDGDLALDDADLRWADPGQERAVLEVAQDRGLAGGGQPGEERGTGVRDGGQEGVGGQAAVQQHDHVLIQGAGKALAVGGLAAGTGTEDRVDHRPGAAGDQGDQADLRIAGGGVLVGALA
jgi:hypothetical protein